MKYLTHRIKAHQKKPSKVEGLVVTRKTVFVFFMPRPSQTGKDCKKIRNAAGETLVRIIARESVLKGCRGF